VKVLVVRAEEGKVVEKNVVEGDLAGVVKEIASSALKEWKPETSDFIVLRDQRDIELPPDAITPESFDAFRMFGLRREEVDGEVRVVITVPIYTISFDNISIGDEVFIEKKVYIIAPHITDELDALFEELAADVTSPKTPPEGISEEGEL